MRVGILGGTFNPVHHAHIEMAKLAMQYASLDRVLLMVAADPPHKTVADGVRAEVRFTMTQLALVGLDGLEACDLEIQRSGKSYTAETLESYHAVHPDDELYLLVGSDMLRDFPTWYHPERITALATILCICRNGQSGGEEAAAKAIRTDFSGKVQVIPEMVSAISSTQIRADLEAGIPISALVPPAVERYVYETGIYFSREMQSMQRQVEKMLTPKRFRHTMGTVQSAARLAALWDVDPKKAQTAALLHDCAKYMPEKKRALYAGDDYDIASVTHAFAGAVVAKTVFGVQDDEILRAIRLHSTGDAGMTKLEMTVFLADVIEPNRDFEGVEAYRCKIAEGPEEAMRFALDCTMQVVKRLNFHLHPATQRAYYYFYGQKKEVLQ